MIGAASLLYLELSRFITVNIFRSDLLYSNVDDFLLKQEYKNSKEFPHINYETAEQIKCMRIANFMRVALMLFDNPNSKISCKPTQQSRN